MPQLDLYTFPTLICCFALFFFVFILLGYVVFFSLSARLLLGRLYFSAGDLFQYIGGVGYMQGLTFFLLTREFTLYRFTGFVSQQM